MLRVIRTRHYEATKHMTREEKHEYDRKRYEAAKKWLAEADTSGCDMTWLTKR
jgi:hypothetical protein